MKKQKIKKIFKKNMIPILFLFFTMWTVFWAFTSYSIPIQSSSWTWSNWSIISFSWSYSSWYYIKNWLLEDISLTVSIVGSWFYVNSWDNSSIIWNYFKWYYYDSLYWYFKLDRSNNTYDNVRVIGSTTLCSSGYWYKLWWKAYSEVSGYINFNHSLSRFVYYCLDDEKLHWYAYWKYIWYQNFEWIWLSFVNDIADLFQNNNSNKFDNDTSIINVSREFIEEELDLLWWEINQVDPSRESIFYIIK